MTNQPYTDVDLRTEAARQHATAAEDPDFVGIAEQMDGAFIESTIVDPDPETGTEPVTGRTWDQLDEEEFGKAHRAIDDLLGRAADVSEWAINLGAEDLKPDEYRLVDGGEGGPTQAAFHIALNPHLELDEQAYREIADVIRGHLAFRDDL